MLVHHLLLVAGVLAVGDAALRAATALGASGLERVVAAAVLAAACAAAEALALGVVGLGSSPVALGLAAAGTWIAARVLLPTPAPGPLAELTRAVADSPLGARLGVGAAVGLLLILAAFFVRYPALGIDGSAYHLPEVVSWVHGGRPGAEIQPSEDFPTAAYPLTNEVLLTWAMSLSRSFVPVALWTPALLALLTAAAWVGLRRLGVPTAAAILAILAIALSPDLIHDLNGPKNDLAALAWLGAAAALSAVAGRRPRLLAVAVLAAGLSVGTKTTTAPLVALVLGLAFTAWWRRRTRNEPAPVLLLAAIAGAVAVGGVWYLRNLLVHGSPFWPLIGAPWGDQSPQAVARLHVSFLERPFASLRAHGDGYLSALAGGLVLLVGGALSGLLVRRRAVLIATAATLVVGLAWATAPFTGIADDPVLDLSLSTTRYLLPACMAGATALALAARAHGVGKRAATGVLAAAVVWSALESAQLGFPSIPGAFTVGLGALAGATAGALAGTVAGRLPVPPRAALAVTAVGVGLALATAAPGWVERHGRVQAAFAAPLIAWFADQPDFRDGSAPISFAPQTIGPLAGDRIQHAVSLIPGSESCPAVRARARRGWVVVREIPAFARRYLVPYSAADCLASERTTFSGGGFRVYRLPAR